MHSHIYFLLWILSPKTELNQQINSSLRICSVTLRMCAIHSFSKHAQFTVLAMLSGKLSNGWKKFVHFLQETNWQYTSEEWIGSRWIGSELADNFSLVNRTVQKPLSIPIISPLHQRKCHVPSSSIPETLIQALSLSKCTMFVSSFLVKKCLGWVQRTLKWTKYT